MNRINATGPAARNREPIFEHLVPLLRNATRVLEIGAGDGTHARHAAECLAGMHWQPSEHPARFELLETGLAGCSNVLVPIRLDVTGAWPPRPFDAVYAANVAHIMGWPAVQALFTGGAGVLAVGGWLCLYGPFFDDGLETVASNTEFDRRLRWHDPAMGLRRVQAVDELARANGLLRIHDWPMPANNRLLVWQKA